MKDITKTLKGFTSLSEFRNFLNEQINDGQEISRGKDPQDKSKEQKAQEEPEAPSGEEASAEQPVFDPVAAPGSQVSIGNKKEDDMKADPEAAKVEISGEKNKIDMKPTTKIDTSNGINSQ